MMLRLFVALLVVAITTAPSCKNTQVQEDPSTVLTPDVPETPEIEEEEDGATMTVSTADYFPPQEEAVYHIKRTPCFGRCEVYSMSIWADGTVRYSGAQFVHHLGIWRGQLRPIQVDSIILEAEKVNFWNLEAEYPTGDIRIADLPAAQVTVRWEGREHTVLNRHYPNPDVPEELAVVEALGLFESFPDDLINGLELVKVADKDY